MPLELDSSKSVSFDVTAMEISELAISTDEKTGGVVYWMEYTAPDGTEIRVSNKQLDFNSTEFNDLIVRANEIKDSGEGVYDSLKQALYEKIMDVEGVSGTIS